MGDITNLLSGLGVSAEAYLEIEDLLACKESSLTETSTVNKPYLAELPVAVSQEPFVNDALKTLSDVLLNTSVPLELAKIAADRTPQIGGVPKRTSAHVLAVVSSNGGVGKSTLIAALSGHLKFEGGKTIAIDLDPQNALQYHLGVTADFDGICNASLTGVNCDSLLLTGWGNAHLLQYGVISESNRRRLEQSITADQYWLARHLECLNLADHDVVIIDTPAGRNLYLEQALHVADEVLVVANANAASFMAFDQMKRLLEGQADGDHKARVHYVINQFDASRSFDFDMCELLKRRYGARLLGIIAKDERISEELAYGSNLLLSTADSVIHQQVRSLAGALKAHVQVGVPAGPRL